MHSSFIVFFYYLLCNHSYQINTQTVYANLFKLFDVLHILYRIKYLHPNLDLGFILLVPELWHASKSALLGMFGGKRRKAGVLHALMLRFTFLVTENDIFEVF